MAYITPITQEKDAAIETTIVEVETVAEREGRHGAQEEEKEEAERRQEIGGGRAQREGPCEMCRHLFAHGDATTEKKA